MFLDNPPPTQADLHFRLLGIPVRVHPMFWLVTVLFGMHRDSTLQDVLIWVVAVFISILVHEFGHALTARYFGAWPHVVLHGFGGLAIFDRRYRDWRKDVLVTFMGPGAGFILAAAIIGVLYATGNPPFFAYVPPVDLIVLPPPLGNDNLWQFTTQMLYINIWWGLLNLLPVYPLDGGQISRTLFFRFARRHNGLRSAVLLSLITGAAVAAYALSRQQPYLALMFGYFAFVSWQELQQMGGGGFGGRRWR